MQGGETIRNGSKIAGAVTAKAVTRISSLALSLMMTTALVAVGTVHTVPVLAQTASADGLASRTSYNIPAQPLSRALVQFSNLTGTQLFFDANLVRGKNSPGISGSVTRGEALGQLLSGSGLVYRVSGNTVTITDPAAANSAGNVAADGSLVLDTITVDGIADTPFGEVNRFLAADSRSAAKIDLPIIETPASVSVVTRDQITTRDAQTTAEVLRYSPGVRVAGSIVDRRDDTNRQNIRGFDAISLIDGTRVLGTGYTTSVSLDPYLIERVEVLGGPASVVYGDAAPGGAISYFSKRPTETPLREVVLGTGNYGRAYGAFDLGGPIDKDGQFLYRLTGVGLTTGTQVDYTKDKRLAFSGAVTWRPSDDTKLTIMAQYQYDPAKSAQTNLPWDGTLLPNPNGQIPTSFFGGEPGINYFHREQFLAGYDFEHRFNEVFTARQNLKYTNVQGEYLDIYTWGGGGTGANHRTLQRDLWGARERVSAIAVDNQLEAKIDTGPLSHTFLFGLDYLKRDFFQKSRWTIASDIDFVNPVYGQFAVPNGFNYGDGSDYGLSQLGIYTQDVIKYENWRLILGARQDWAENTSQGRAAGATKYTEKSDAFTWRAGLAYVFDSGFTPYASYSTSFQPQSGETYAGTRFVPTTGEQYEIGLKYQPPGLKSFFQLALFDIRQQNVLTSDDAHPNYSVQRGEIHSRGVTPSVTLSLTDSLDLVGSYTYLKLEQSKASANDSAIIGNVPWYAPEHTASIWANYTFQEGQLIQGLKIGAGLRYVGEGYVDNSQTYKIPDYLLVDASLSYDFGVAKPELKGLSAQLNAQNLFDKTYVDRCNSYNCWYGDRRTITASLKYRW